MLFDAANGFHDDVPIFMGEPTARVVRDAEQGLGNLLGAQRSCRHAFSPAPGPGECTARKGKFPGRAEEAERMLTPGRWRGSRLVCRLAGRDSTRRVT